MTLHLKLCSKTSCKTTGNFCAPQYDFIKSCTEKPIISKWRIRSISHVKTNISHDRQSIINIRLTSICFVLQIQKSLITRRSRSSVDRYNPINELKTTGWLRDYIFFRRHPKSTDQQMIRVASVLSRCSHHTVFFLQLIFTTPSITEWSEKVVPLFV